MYSKTWSVLSLPVYPSLSPYMAARMYCRNVTDHAKAAANSRKERRSEFIAELDRRMQIELGDDPPYATWR
jgi:hypothetical protein